MVKLMCGALGLAVALGMAAGVGTTPTPRVLAECNESIDTTDSFSMDCAPTVIPNLSEPLTEADVAEPGWNAVPGGAAPGGGPHH